ncbi:translation initiation factor 2D [Paragonimus westermani]|uniref:Translation initiation factor 2D n=1 Tax=Paragonimus westermani TaxID=34504 RepID=A0A5J4NCF8_9TREM|nr:translation initiation factor 2D [Paragonimus westermani]
MQVVSLLLYYACFQMFLKPITIKSNSRIKASERKQLLEEFQRQYPMVLPLPAALASNSVLRLKIATSDSTYVSIFKFDNQPLLIEYQKALIPSLFLLWLLPDLLPHFKTHDGIIPKLASGADLMIPGIVLDQPLSPSSFDYIQKGVLCAVSTTSSRSVPLFPL